jgi:hypothetical protein
VVVRTAASFLSAVENALDTLDGMNVVRGVVATEPRCGLLKFPILADCGNFGYPAGVPSLDRKRELFENIARLRRASREAPQNRDIVAVRSALERDLGETVSQRLAASLLGVSHTALRRWIEAGDLPTIYSRSGRTEIPVQSLLELYEAVQLQRRTGARRRHVLEPSLSEARNRAQQLRPRELVPEEEAQGHGHGRADRRALAYHRALGRRLRRSMVEQARQRLWQWRAEGRIDARHADQWEAVLERPVREVRQIISEDTPRGRDLRQNSPFAGMLSEAERRRLLQEIR